MLYFFKDYWGKYELGILAKRPRSGGAAQSECSCAVSLVRARGEEATETAPNLANETRSNAPLFR
jgi:hypothetical protein